MATRATEISAEERHEFGKGASRRLRREGRVPAVVYGRDEAPRHVSFDYHEFFLATKGNSNALLDVTVDGDKQLTLVRDRQINPLSRKIEHADLIRVDRNEKVSVTVPVVTEGEPVSGLVATVEYMEIEVLAPVTDIPEQIDVSVEGLTEEDSVTVADLKLPADVTSELDPETIVVSITYPAVDHELEAADAELAAEQSAEADAAAPSGDAE